MRKGTVDAGKAALGQAFRGTDRAGVATEVRGVDLLEIRDGLIARKDTCRKVRTG